MSKVLEPHTKTSLKELASNLENAVAEVFVGDKELISLSVIGLLGSLHILIEDIPGVGKTTLALALSQAAGMSFSRIQFTPDMLPGDVLGMNIWDPLLRDFVFRQGPIEVNTVLADELNRTSPRTQSAFLEAMQEAQVTIDGKTRPLPKPFFLIATQNPSHFAGTFPLPEAELDRFGISFSIGYPSIDDEAEILRQKSLPDRLVNARIVADPGTILNAQSYVSNIHVSEPMRNYIVSLIRATRNSPDIRLGASPRAGLFLQQASRARAATLGRDFTIPEDAEALAPAVLAHRIQLSSQARLAQIDPAKCIRTLCGTIPKPTGL